MTQTRNVLAGCAAIVLFAAPAFSQTLADVARKEEARRAEVKQPAKTYTNADLKAGPRDVPVPASDAAPAEGYVSKTTGKVMTAEEMVAASQAVIKEEEKKEEPSWRSRAESIRADVKKAQALVDTLAGAANPDSPAQAAALSKARAALDLAEKRWAKFETQAGVAKVPKAWIQ